MPRTRSLVLNVQALVYLVETLLLTGIIALASGASPEPVLGPLASLLIAAALPLPCHLLWLAHFLWHERAARRPAVSPATGLQPVPATLRA